MLEIVALRDGLRSSTTMASEGFDVEEWDADFLDQLVQAEELALSTQIPHHQQPLPRPPPPQPQRAPARDDSYSPPRELSQRTHEKSYTGGIPDCSNSFALPAIHFEKELEIDILKKELSRVSQQLIHLEQECSELRKERDKKEEDLKAIHSRFEAKDAEVQHTKNMQMDCFVSSPTAPGISTVNRHANPSNKQLGSCTKSCNAVGVQTDKTTEESTSAVYNFCRGPEKLFSLWNSDDQKLGRVLVSKLFMTCEADFHVLFGYLNSPQKDSNTALLYPAQPREAAKVSHLYSVLTKISNDSSRLEELLEALIDLCNLKNVVIVHRSLRVLHKVLCISFSMGKEFGKRENVIFEEHLSENTSDINRCWNLKSESLNVANIAEMLKQEQVPFGLKFSNVETAGHTGFFDRSFGASMSVVHWASLFGHMCQIAIKSNEEQIRHEALSIMNLILMRHNAYSERDKFVGEPVFQSLSQLLRREAGFSVQDHAVHTLYLLCNCPKVIGMLYSGFKEDGEHASSKDNHDKSISTFHWLNEILIGLADCVAFNGSATAEEMKLRRNAIVFLAFLASSGKTGFEIVLNHRLPKGTNFLAIILRSLLSDLDLQASKSANKSGIIREQSLLIREALILLNRLVSHPQYSIPVLQTLTNTRDMASTTVDVVNRLTQKSKLLWQGDNPTKQIRESEIVDLARVFKRRVFTYLGDSIS